MEPFASRRQAVLDRFPEGVAVFFSAPVALRNTDVEHEYRQDSDFYYLTGVDEPECALVLRAEPTATAPRATLFVRPSDPERAVWDGDRLGVDGARRRTGIEAVHPIGELAERLPGLFTGARRLLARVGDLGENDGRVFEAVRKARGRGRVRTSWPTEIVDPATVVHELRVRKSDGELDQMRRAAEITRDAHLAAMRAAAPGVFEYELEAILRETFMRRGAERVAYGPIVGSGANATVLHYRTNKKKLEAGELVLIDAGCEADYYACDVTRTFPVGGRFSDAQRVVYEIVLAAQEAAVDAVRPGATIDGVHDVAVRVLAEGLVRAQLLAGDAERAIAEERYKAFYMHRTSHFLGMEVHDVGAYYRGGEPRPLEPGMVITVEPGLYFGAADTRVPEAYRGLGVRIEDCVAVTDGPPRVLTHDIPKRVADVERACASA